MIFEYASRFCMFVFTCFERDKEENRTQLEEQDVEDDIARCGGEEKCRKVILDTFFH